MFACFLKVGDKEVELLEGAKGNANKGELIRTVNWLQLRLNTHLMADLCNKGGSKVPYLIVTQRWQASSGVRQNMLN